MHFEFTGLFQVLVSRIKFARAATGGLSVVDFVSALSNAFRLTVRLSRRCRKCLAYYTDSRGCLPHQNAGKRFNHSIRIDLI